MREAREELAQANAEIDALKQVLKRKRKEKKREKERSVKAERMEAALYIAAIARSEGMFKETEEMRALHAKLREKELARERKKTT